MLGTSQRVQKWRGAFSPLQASSPENSIPGGLSGQPAPISAQLHSATKRRRRGEGEKGRRLGWQLGVQIVSAHTLKQVLDVLQFHMHTPAPTYKHTLMHMPACLHSCTQMLTNTYTHTDTCRLTYTLIYTSVQVLRQYGSESELVSQTGAFSQPQYSL